MKNIHKSKSQLLFLNTSLSYVHNNSKYQKIHTKSANLFLKEISPELEKSCTESLKLKLSNHRTKYYQWFWFRKQMHKDSPVIPLGALLASFNFQSIKILRSSKSK